MNTTKRTRDVGVLGDRAENDGSYRHDGNGRYDLRPLPANIKRSRRLKLQRRLKAAAARAARSSGGEPSEKRSRTCRESDGAYASRLSPVPRAFDGGDNPQRSAVGPERETAASRPDTAGDRGSDFAPIAFVGGELSDSVPVESGDAPTQDDSRAECENGVVAPPQPVTDDKRVSPPITPDHA